MPQNHDDDIAPADMDAITSALRLIKDILFTLGAEGDECIQRLVSVEASFMLEGPATAQMETFRAFYLGLTEQEKIGASMALPPWSGDARLRIANETGGKAARLNVLCRQKNLSRGWNVGPFDPPDVRETLARAAEAARISGARAE